MNQEEKYSYWLDNAEYDLDSAGAMFKSGRYVYVTFMCQQALEKLAKGLYNYYIGDQIPRVHNISFVLDKVLDQLRMECDQDTLKLFDKLASYYIEGRYPTFKSKVSQLVNKEEARNILNKTKEVFKWMKSLKG